MISHDEMRSQMADEHEDTGCARCDADITEDGRGCRGGECHVCRHMVAKIEGDTKAQAGALMDLVRDVADLDARQLYQLLRDLFESGERVGAASARAVVRDVSAEARGQ